MNYYQGQAVSDLPPDQPLGTEAPTDRPVRSPFPAADGIYSHPQGLPTTAMGWEIQPDGLRALLVRVHAEYADPAGVDLYVTENGVAFDDRSPPTAASPTPTARPSSPLTSTPCSTRSRPACRSAGTSTGP